VGSPERGPPGLGSPGQGHLGMVLPGEVRLDRVLPGIVCLDQVLVSRYWIKHPARGSIHTLGGVSPLTKSHGWRMELDLQNLTVHGWNEELTSLSSALNESTKNVLHKN